MGAEAEDTRRARPYETRSTAQHSTAAAEEEDHHHHGENHHSEDVGPDLGAPGEPCIRGLRVHAQPAAVLERNSGADHSVPSRYWDLHRDRERPRVLHGYHTREPLCGGWGRPRIR